MLINSSTLKGKWMVPIGSSLVIILLCLTLWFHNHFANPDLYNSPISATNKTGMRAWSTDFSRLKNYLQTNFKSKETNSTTEIQKNTGEIDSINHTFVQPNECQAKRNELERYDCASGKQMLDPGWIESYFKMCAQFPVEEEIEGQPVLFHMYHRGTFSLHMTAVLLSYILTQRLKKTRLIIWTDSDISQSPYLLPYLPYLENRVLDLKSELTRIGLFKFYNEGVLGHGKRKRPPPDMSISDIVRTVLLHNYGGLWLDTDTILLRDLYPFFKTGYDFAPTWGTFNIHVLRMRRNSTLTRTLIEAVQKFPYHEHYKWPRMPFSRQRNFVYGDALYSYCKYDLKCPIQPLSIAFFDTAWRCGADMHAACYKFNGCYAFYLDRAFVWHHRANKIHGGGCLGNNDTMFAQVFKMMQNYLETNLPLKNQSGFLKRFCLDNPNHFWNQGCRTNLRICDGESFD